jgi:SAM-dependent methyltransferase
MQVSQAPSARVLREHYEIERELSDRLRNAPASSRRELYSAIYDEFHYRVTYLRYLDQSAAPVDGQDAPPSRAMRIVRRLLTPDSVFLEIGAGDCSFAREVSGSVKRVVAIDVSDFAMRKGAALPANVETRVTGGVDVPVPAGSIDVAFASNLIEHLHPDDAFEQTRNVYDALKPGGVYVCITPNRMYGPHDVSGQFGDAVATGFHLKEYTYRDIVALFEQVGFTDVRGYLDLRGKLVAPFPAIVAMSVERLFARVPTGLRRRLMNPMPIRALLFVRVIACKPGGA